LFVNDEKLMKEAYSRYLENHLRKTFDFTGTPIMLTCRNRNEKKGIAP
jgi:GTP-binding protein